MKSNQHYQKQLQVITSQNPQKPGQVNKGQYSQYVQNQPVNIVQAKPKGNATQNSGMLSNGQIQVQMTNDGKYSMSDQKNYKSFSNGGTAMVPQSLTSHQQKMNNLNDGQNQNQYVYKNKQKQSKTTSANSPVASTHQLMINIQAAQDNYVGTTMNSPPASGLSNQNPQQMPTTIQIKTGKMIYNTANHSPLASQQKLQKLIDKDQNLNLIHQLQKNQQSMLYRISQQQIQDVIIGNGFQEDFNNDEYTDQGSRGDNTVSTIQHLPNMNGHASMSSKQKAQIAQNQGVRSRMSLKQQPSGGVASAGTQGSIRASQKGGSATEKQGTGTYNQKRLQQNSLSNNLKSQGSQVMPPPIQSQQQAILIQSNRLGSQEFLRKKSGKKNTQQQNQKRTQYINQQTQPQVNGGTPYTQYQTAQNQQLPSQSSAHLSNYYTAESQQQNNASAPQQQSLIQAPHFIKVKSKTNANPTRQNSPRTGQQRYTGKFSASHGYNPMQESQHQEAFSMPNSPAKEDAQETLISMGTSQSIINKSNKAKNLSVSNNILRNSIDNKMRQQSKGHSTKDVFNQINGVNPRIQSGVPSHGQSFQNNKRQLNSPNSPHIGQPVAYLTQNGQLAYQTQGISQMDQQEKKYLNMAVSKNIGGIASGNARRENRNQMMKNNQQLIDNKSVIGSMGSMGSLGPFMGVQESSGTEGTDGFHTMKHLPGGDQANQTHYSQLQQMHLNNVNPMFFATGEAIHNQNQKNSLLMAGGTMTNMINQQHKTMGGPIQHMGSPIHNQSQQSKNSTVGSQGGPMISQKKYSIQGTHQFDNPNYYEQQNLSSQAKNNVIHVRKVAPQSKTAVNGSKNPSIDRSQMQNQNQTQGQRINQSNKYQQYTTGINQTGKKFAQTTKPSYNSSPVNRQKNGAVIVGGYNQNLAVNKRPQQVRQQPIGQPVGDNTAGLAQQDIEYINNQSNTFYTNQSSQIKTHHLAQSVLVGDQAANQIGGKQNTQKQFSKSIIGAPQTSQTALNENYNQLIQGGKLKLKVMSETASPNGFVSKAESGQNSKMSRGDGVRRSSSKGGLKSQTGTGRTKNTGGNTTEVGQKYFQQYFQQKKHSNYIQINDKYHPGYGKFAQVDSPKDGSIERVRQDDMILQEHQITSMNKQLQNVINLDEQPQKSTTQSNANQQYIIKQLDTKDVSKLSPRSKEVYLIKKLITDCFKKYNKPPKTQLELYKIGKMLGKGAFGKVNLGLHRLTRKLVAIKSINMDFLKEESQKKKIMNEINILKSLRHPNNIKILETFQTDKHHMIVMELCPGGDLLNYVRKRRKLTEKYAQFVFKQIMEGIAYLHDNNVAHRDIKLDNILLDGHGNIKLGDFGVSRKIEENEILFEQCGTPAYIAPEIVKDMGYKGFPVDIWSAGICLYAMLYGNVPFKANQIGDLNTVEQLNQDIEYKDTVSQEAIDLMKTMLQKVPKQRATAQDVLEDKWLNQEDESEHIDIFDEQELELIRKEFTYVVQRKKLKDFKEQKQKLDEADVPCQQASRRADDLNTEFTECSIQTHENSLLKNDSSRSVILCPFNTQTGDKNADKIIALTVGMMEDKDLMIRFHPRVRELDRNYEKLNNQDFDNGVYHKYAYKQKVNPNQKNEDVKEEDINQSDVQMNNLVADPKETARKIRRENADINYHNYYIKINENIIKDTEKLGFPIQYIQKCIKENANNHCTTTYYLLCMDQNF